MARKYELALLQAMQTKAHTVTERGLPILIKPIPDSDEVGVMDPRLYASMKPQLTMMKLIPKSLMSKMNPLKDINNMRKMFNGVKSVPVAEHVVTKRLSVKNGDVDVPIRIYSPEAGGKDLPIFYYIHGGGWAAGSPDVVEEMCKLVVARAQCVSVNIDYRLMPENPYPAGLNDCWAVLNWIYDNAASFGGDNEKICISGDSAGGNLSAACALKDRDAGTNKIKLQALIYPSVNMAGKQDELYHFDKEKEFTYGKKHAAAIDMMIDMMGSAMSDKDKPNPLLGDVDMMDPYLSPYVADLTGVAPAIILYGEYDFLKVECESYARKLQKAGVKVKAVRYAGLSHGFADVVGTYPQAEDCMNEISDFMTANFT